MAGSLDRRSRSSREAQAYRTVQLGAVSGGAFTLTTVLWIVGAMGAAVPVVLLIVTALLVARFRQITSR